MRTGVVHVVTLEAATSGDQPRVEVINESLWSTTELREAVLTGALTSGLLCALAGLGVGFYLGFREGRR